MLSSIHNLSLWSLIPALALASFVGDAIEYDAATEKIVDLSSFTTEGVIPFAGYINQKFPFVDPPLLRYKIDASDSMVYSSPMDTGSTGIMLSAINITGYETQEAWRYPPGFEFLSSSKRLWRGNWIPKTIYFQDADITATVPVLAINESMLCSNYKEFYNGVCPSDSITKYTAMPPNINYIGVGFGRQHDGQTGGNPDKNVLLNIATIRGSPVHSNFRPGYTITKQGVHVGITASNSKGYKTVKLTQQTEYSSSPLDWNQVTGCVQVGTNICLPCSALLDTGISQMYLTINYTVPRVEATNPSTGGVTHALADGQKVLIRFGANGNYIESYGFTVGDSSNANTPLLVSTTIKRNATTGFANTGRHFYQNHNIMFDAVGGYWGMKYVGSS